MNPQRWQAVKAVLAEALDHPPDERAAYLETACGADDMLRIEVERLLNLEAETGTFLEHRPPGLPSVHQVVEEILDEEDDDFGPQT